MWGFFAGSREVFCSLFFFIISLNLQFAVVVEGNEVHLLSSTVLKYNFDVIVL